LEKGDYFQEVSVILYHELQRDFHKLHNLHLLLPATSSKQQGAAAI
jgi:hypothetical protein